ncbi:hypothetical protein GCM10019996_08820 [Lentilactobacillus parakefiri]
MKFFKRCHKVRSFREKAFKGVLVGFYLWHNEDINFYWRENFDRKILAWNLYQKN